MIAVHTVDRIRPGDKDVYGDPSDEEVDTQRIDGASVAPRLSSDTNGEARDGAVVGLTLYAPHGADIVRTDIIVIDEDALHPYKIDGELGDWSSPLTGSRPGFTADLIRAEG